MAKLGSLKPRLGALPPRLSPPPGDERARDRYRSASQPWRAWYSTSRWQKLRIKVLVRDAYTCQRTGALCNGSGNDPYAPVVNHKRPHRGDQALFWDEKNLETVAKHVHDSLVQREEREAGW
jgi:5-methylcytosine-specific restriction protein A